MSSGGYNVISQIKQVDSQHLNGYGISAKQNSVSPDGQWVAWNPVNIWYPGATKLLGRTCSLKSYFTGEAKSTCDLQRARSYYQLQTNIGQFWAAT